MEMKWFMPNKSLINAASNGDNAERASCNVVREHRFGSIDYDLLFDIACSIARLAASKAVRLTAPLFNLFCSLFEHGACNIKELSQLIVLTRLRLHILQ
jgi:hypothetical protein